MILLSKNICVGIRRKNSIQLCAGKYLPANLGFGERQESLGGVRRYRRRYEIVVLKSRQQTHCWGSVIESAGSFEYILEV